jgi:response regulator RpfG family c-di-GMP phosphodiesterase
MLPSILIVDDEVEVLKALKRLLHQEYQVNTFTCAKEALDYFQRSPTHIVISDLMMPGMNGADFLKAITSINSRCKRIALTGFASAELAKQAINEGQIASYLTKPWDNSELKETLQGLIYELRSENKKFNALKRLSLDNKQFALEQQSHVLVHNMMLEEQADHDKEIAKLKQVNNELVMLSANVIAMYSKEPPGHSLRVAQQAKTLASRLNLTSPVNVYFAALYHRIGIASLADNLLSQPWYKLNLKEQNAYSKFAHSSADVMSSLQLLKQSAKIVGKLFDYRNEVDDISDIVNDPLLISAMALRLVIEFDLLVSGVTTGEPMSPDKALSICEQQVGILYDKNTFKFFVNMYLKPNKCEAIQCARLVNGLDVGMVLAQDIVDSQQHKLLSEGTSLTMAHIEQLQEIQHQQECILVVYIHNKSSLN